MQIKHSTITIPHLLGSIIAGDYLIPTFSRELTSYISIDDKELFNNIISQYPIGTLLFYKEVPLEEEILGYKVEEDFNRREKKYYLLKDYWIVSALFEYLIPPKSKEHLAIDLYFNLKEFQVAYRHEREKPYHGEEQWMVSPKLSTLYDRDLLYRYIEKLESSSLSTYRITELREKARDFHQIFWNTVIPCTILIEPNYIDLFNVITDRGKLCEYEDE